MGIPEDTMSEFEPGQTDDRPANESAGVGARVTSILEAAEQAAEQIRSDALREASETMRAGRSGCPGPNRRAFPRGGARAQRGRRLRT